MGFALVPSFISNREQLTSLPQTSTWISWFECGGYILLSLTAHEHIPEFPGGPAVLEALIVDSRNY